MYCRKNLKFHSALDIDCFPPVYVFFPNCAQSDTIVRIQGEYNFTLIALSITSFSEKHCATTINSTEGF